MKTRLYTVSAQGYAMNNWHASLKEARPIAHALASRGLTATIRQMTVSGPDTDILLKLCNLDVFVPENHPEFFTLEVYETHQPGAQIPIPGDEMVYTVYVQSEIQEEKPKPKKKTTRKKK